MRYILVDAYDLDSHPWGGIIDVEKANPTAEENLLFDAIDRAIAAKNTPWAYGEVNHQAMSVDSFETFPFTGTIEDSVEIFVVDLDSPSLRRLNQPFFSSAMGFS